jgi:homocysteine S-methyltransferase
MIDGARLISRPHPLYRAPSGSGPRKGENPDRQRTGKETAMARYRHDLPQLKGGTFLSDGGMETTLIFHEGMELPHFASYVLLETPDGRERLDSYYRRYLDIARAHGTGFILDTATWRANPDWGSKLGHDSNELDRLNREAVEMAIELCNAYDAPGTPCVVSGAIGPRGDGYKGGTMSENEAERYHAAQVESFAEAGADMVSAYTLTSIEEAAGIARAAKTHGMPCAISFTLETDGKLVTGPSIGEAIERTDEMTGNAPAYYLINCAHPTHFARELRNGGSWRSRILGVKANASTRSHAELDESETLDAGDPFDLGRRYVELKRMLPSLRVVGGCCGTDHRHVRAICEAVVPGAA